MRWEITKKAWVLAKERFPKTERLFVELPDKFLGTGECSVFDLDAPERPLGKIAYEAKCVDGQPRISMSLGERTAEASLPKFGAMTIKTAHREEILERRQTIDAPTIMEQYKDMAVLGEQIAYLIAGHPNGLVKTEQNTDEGMHAGLVETWVVENGFPREAFPHVEVKLAALGFKISRKQKKKFMTFEKVRVVDPRLMQYNEGARILGYKRDKDKQNWYQIIVDGSEKPIWLNEMQLAKNEAGIINDINSADANGNA